jgi:hypothetical protein
MVIKDFYCTRCNSVAADLSVASGDERLMLPCCSCGTRTEHQSICAGGTKKRYRFNDWSGVDLSGCVRISKPEAVTETFDLDQATGRTYNRKVIKDRHVSGVLCEDRPRFSEDSLADRHDRVKHRDKVRKGKTPIFFGTKGRLPG